MKTTEYLYGVPPYYFKGMEYFEAVKKKRDLAKTLIRDISLDISFKEPEEVYKKKLERLNDIQKAFIYNDELLKEFERSCK